MPLREDNHYVSCGYLKRWASSGGRIWTYRILVSHPHVPLWKECFPKEVAYHPHLYTRVMAGQATDEIERWLDSEFETPAEEALQKATSDARLTPDDWKRLIHFLAAAHGGPQLPEGIVLGPTARKLRPDLIGNVETYPSFPFRVWPWQFVPKTIEMGV